MATENSSIVIQNNFAPEKIQQIISSAKEFEIIKYGSLLTEEQILNVKGFIVHGHLKIGSEVMNSFPNLKVITTVGVGYNHIDVEEASKRRIRVGNTPDCLNDCTADMGFALLLGSARNVVTGDAIARSPETEKFNLNWHSFKVTGSTLGIVGMGRIGSKVAQRAKGFNMKILYHNRNKKDQIEEYGAEYCSKLDDLLKQSDFVMICAPSTPETIGMFSSHQFSMMKPTATLINIARGNLVNHDDLTLALKNGTIRAAALDVTDPEPLPRDHPLLKLDNVLITPHLGSATEETRKAMVEMALENIIAGLKGQDLPYGVN